MIKVRTHEAQLVLEPAGELDITTCPPITDALTAGLADATVRSVVFDLRDVTFMDSSGIKCLVLALRRMRVREGVVTVCNARPTVARLIRILGLDREVNLVASAPATAGERTTTRRPEAEHHLLDGPLDGQLLGQPDGQQRRLING